MKSNIISKKLVALVLGTAVFVADSNAILIDDYGPYLGRGPGYEAGIAWSNPYAGDCYFSVVLGRVRGNVDDGNGRDHFQIQIEDANGDLLSTNGSRPGPINVGTTQYRSQALRNRPNNRYAVGGWYLNTIQNPLPLTVKVYESDQTEQFDVVRTVTISRRDFQNIGSRCFPANTPPVANAGEDIKYGIPNMLVYLDGTNSTDADGDNLSYIWTQISGPKVELIDAETATPSFYYPPGRADQVIEFELIVNDGTENSEPDTVTIIHNGRSNGRN